MTKHTVPKSVPVFILMVFLLLCSQAAYAAGTGEPLPPEAQQVMKKALIAVEQQQWSLAVRYFQDARKHAPQAPELFFNLGLAESKLPSREFRSIAWFKAYLTANPGAANAKAVRDTIEGLNVRAEGTIMKLVEQGRQMSQAFPDEWGRKGAEGRLGVILAKIGDSQGAKESARMSGSSSSQDSIAEELAKNGDITAAKEVLSQMDSKDTTYRCSAASKIAWIQAESGDISGAMSTVDTCDDDKGFRKYEGLIAIARAMDKTGRTDEARAILVRARYNTQQSIFKYDANYVGQAQAGIGDIRGAMETASVMQDASWKGWIYDAIDSKAREYAKAGQIQKALSAADLLPERATNSYNQVKEYRNDARRGINDVIGQMYKAEFDAKLKAGDYAGAQVVMGKMPPGGSRDDACRSLVSQAIKENDLTKAEVFFDLMSVGDYKEDAAEALAEGLARAGKQTEARSLLRGFSDACKKASFNGWRLKYIVGKQCSIGDIEGAMETALMLKEASDKAGALSDVGGAMVERGDLEGAKRTLLLIPKGQTSSAEYLSVRIAKSQAEKGNLSEAQSLAGTLSDSGKRDDVYKSLSEECAKRGMFAEALGFASKIANVEGRINTLRSIAGYQNGLGYIEGRDRTFKQVKEAISSLADPYRRADKLDDLTSTFSSLYDVRSMRETLAEYVKAISLVQDTSRVLSHYSYFRGKARTAGLYGEAKQRGLWGALAQVPKVKAEDRKDKLNSIAVAFADVFDLANARSVADLQESDSPHVRIIEKKISAGLLAEATEDVRHLKEGSRDGVYSSIAEALAGRGDIQGAIKNAGLIKDTTSSGYDRAVDAIAVAYFKAGNRAEAGRYALKPTNYNIQGVLEKVLELKDFPLAKQMIGRVRYGKDSDSVTLAVALLKSGDLPGAREVIGSITDESYRRNACNAVAQAGNPDFALEISGLLRNDSNRAGCLINIAAAYYKAGKMEQGEKTLGRVKSQYPWLYKANIPLIAGFLAEAGLVKQAEEALLEVHPRDGEFEQWKDFVIAQDKSKLGATPMKEQYFAARVASAETYEDAAKNGASMADPLDRSFAFYLFASRALGRNDTRTALQAAAAISDNGYRAIILEEVLVRAVLTRDKVVVEKAVSILPAGAAGGQIIATALENTPSNADRLLYTMLHARAPNAFAAMPDGIAKVKAYRTLFRTATQTKENAVASNAKAMAGSAAARVGEDDKLLMAYMASAQASVKNIPPEKLEAERKEMEARKQKVTKWVNLLEWTGDYYLNAPVFLDLQSYIQSLNSKSSANDIFNGLVGAMDRMADMLIKFKRIDKGLD
jgi:hypothetical protein